MATKTFSVDEHLDPALAELVRGAEPWVEPNLGWVAGRVDVGWGPGGPSPTAGPTARLRLTDDGVTRTGDFTAKDLRDKWEFEWKVRRVWDEVQKERVRIHWGRFQEALAEEGGA